MLRAYHYTHGIQTLWRGCFAAGVEAVEWGREPVGF